MDTVDLGGSTYIKASRIAKDMGYTPDYVGQLCRGGKIDATLVGRTWYVRSGALEEYKKEKPRSNKMHIVRELHRTRQEEEHYRNPYSKQYGTSISPAYRSRMLEADITYLNDDGEPILPTVKPRVVQEETGNVSSQRNAEEQKRVVDPLDKAENASDVRLKINRSDASMRVVRGSLTPSSHIEQNKRRPVRKHIRAAADKTTPLPAKESSKKTKTSVWKGGMPLMAGGIALVIALWTTNLLINGVWSYTETGSVTEGLETTYGVASVSHIVESAKKLNK